MIRLSLFNVYLKHHGSEHDRYTELIRVGTF